MKTNKKKTNAGRMKRVNPLVILLSNIMESAHKEKNEEKELENKKMALSAIGAFVVVMVLWALSFLLFFFKDFEKQGQFGDMFGAVNALFSGLAFAGLIITLFLQKNELSLQREELQLTREEMKNQRLEFEKENETLRYQRFENLLYNMLNLQQEIVAGLRCTYENRDGLKVPTGEPQKTGEKYIEQFVAGRELFRFAFEEMQIPMTGGILKSINGFRHYLELKGNSQYGVSWVPTYFDHYFRHFYRILKYIDEQDIPFEVAYKYTSFLRGTLSRYELVWIYYNCLNEDNYKLKAMVEKYSMLKNMRKELLARNKEYKELLKTKGVSEEALRERGFYLTDYDYYLTDCANDSHKFYVGAFYNSGEISEGINYINRVTAVIVGDGSNGKVPSKEISSTTSAV